MKFRLLLSLLFFPFLIFSQEDEMFLDFENAKDPDKRIEIAYDITKENMNNPDTAIYYLKKALVDSTKVEDKSLVGKALNALGVCYYYLGDGANFEKYAFKALTLAKHINDEDLLVGATKNYALSLDVQGNYKESIAIYFDLLEQNKKKNDSLDIAMTLNDLGNSYVKFNQLRKGLQYQFEGENYLNPSSEYDLIRGNIYNSIGIIYNYLNVIDSAIYYYEKALIAKEKVGNLFSINNTLNNLCICIDYKATPQKAIDCFNELLINHQEIGDMNGIIHAKVNLSIIYNYQEKYSKSIQLLKEEYENDRIDHLDVKMKFYEVYSVSLYLNEDYKEAYNVREEYEVLKDSVRSVQNANILLELDEKYQAKEKESKIKVLSVENENKQLKIQKQLWTIISIVILSATILISLLILFTYHKRKQRRLLQLKLQQLKEEERTRIAQDMHDEISSGLNRLNLRNELIKNSLEIEDFNGMNDLLDKSRVESKKLSANIREIIWSLNPKNDTFDVLLSFLRNYSYEVFDEAKIAVSIDFPDNLPAHPINPELRRNTFLIVKEAFNNILKYAKAENVDFKISVAKNDFSILIKDNGKGMNDSSSKEVFGGNGLENMKSRAEKSGGSFNYETKSGEYFLIRVEHLPFINLNKNETN